MNGKAINRDMELKVASNRYHHSTACRVCLSTNLKLVLDLGMTPPANAYVREQDLPKREEYFPLALYHCKDCSLLQLLDVVEPEVLFKNYHYFTGASKPMVDHFKEYAETVILQFLESSNDLVIDIGGNDGVLLENLVDKARVLNVDPADNLGPVSESRGVPFYPAFFTSQTAEELLRVHGEARVVTANNVFAHTDPIRDVFEGVSRLIGDTGIFIFEVHWAKHLIDERCFDQIYHEHLCFYSLHALIRLVETTEMRVFRVEVVPTQGKSLRVYASRAREQEESVGKVLRDEVAAGLLQESTYETFAENVESNKKKLLQLLKELKSAGKKIVGYGAPAKGNTLLNYYGIGPETLDYLTDTTEAKQGLFSPGSRIPIVNPERLLTDRPDYILLLAWNFKDSILEKERELRGQGVKFIVTVPRLEIL